MATPTYTELAQLAGDGAFIDRCSIAVAVYARYILAEDPGVALHNSRAAWAKGAFQNPRSVVGSLATAIALDGVFASQNPLNFGTTPDTGAGSVQVAVEATINATVLKF